jgi:hypothetical protein
VPGKRGSGTLFWLASFLERTSRTAFQCVPSQKYPWLFRIFRCGQLCFWNTSEVNKFNKSNFKRMKCRIKLQGHLSEPFLRLRQGDALACLLFNIALEKVIRDSGIEKRGIIYYKSVYVVAYADGLDVIGRSEKDVKEAFIKLNNEAQKMGLNINEEKTKYMEITA